MQEPQLTSLQPAVNDLARVFNTALIGTRVTENRDLSRELMELMESPAFNSILSAIRSFARLHGLSEKQAAEQVIGAFRRADSLWTDYVIQEGVSRLKS